MVTLADVARTAGVSVATVSRVLNGLENVREATRARVLEVVRDLGYSPNANARSLMMGHTRTLGIVVPEIGNPYWSEVLQGIQDVAMKAGYTFNLCSSNYDDAEIDRAVRAFVDKRVDGLLLAVGIYDAQLIRLLRTYQIPVVFLSPAADSTEWDCVHTDDEAGSYQATRYLIQQGHSRIAMISGRSQDLASQLRVAGFLKAMQEAKLDVPADYLTEGNWLIDGGERAGRRLLGRQERPSAIMTVNNQTAVGLVKAARSLHVRVPGDLAIATFGDFGIATDLFPFITTVVYDARASGMQAVTLLLDRIRGSTRRNRTVVCLQPALRPALEEGDHME